MITPKVMLQQITITIGAIMKKEYINEVAWSKIFCFLKSNKLTYPTYEFASGRPDSIIQTLYRPTREIIYWLEQIDKYM